MTKSVEERFSDLKDFYASGHTRDIGFRLDGLRRLRGAINEYSGELEKALHADLRKSPQESYLTEIAIVLKEIRIQMKNLRKWSRDKKVSSPPAMFPSRSRVIYEPKGTVLVMAPWNYPFQLALNPVVGAIAAGNCVAVKPSTTSAATCAVIGKIIAAAFPEHHVAVFDGDHAQADELLRCRFDHIFFTGGASFGRMVMMEAARNLIPVTLELGGKSPCIVDREADLDTAARRIVWGKLVNAGQTCIAPDYLLVHSSVKDALIAKMTVAVEKFYGPDIRESPLYPRIISDKAFRRLTGYLSGPGNIIYGGAHDLSTRFIAPTIIDGADPESPLMREEIFGPILPVMTFDDIGRAAAFVNSREKPLALYYFGRKKEGRRILGLMPSGGACINDTLMHVVNPALPFGGAGGSGMGRYHGRYSFETFSNARAAVVSRTRPDIPLRYPPYKRFGLLKRLF
jgi:aldehyde dehydrogenase (NAD+)